jgi:hypothetical protein
VKTCFTIILALVGVVSSALAKPTSTFKQYAGAYTVSVPETAATVVIRLDSLVYERMSFEAIHGPNVAFFTQSGEALPWRLLVSDAQKPESLWVDLAVAPDLVISKSSEQQKLSVRMSQPEFSLEWNSKHTVRHQDQAWWIDVRPEPFHMLRFVMDTSSPFIAQAQLESSHDLIHWSSYGVSQGLSLWNDGAIQLQSLTMPLATRVDFLRVRMRSERGTPKIRAIQGLRIVPASEVLVPSKVFDPIGRDSTAWDYKALGSYPVVGARIEVGASGVWGRGELQVKSHDSTSWRTVANLSVGDSLAWSHPIRETHWRYWVRSPVVAFGNQTPRLRLWYKPDQIELATGASTHIWLAVGLHPDRSSAPLQLWDSLPPPVPVVLGEYQEWLGKEALQAPWIFPWVLLLWLALLVVLALVGWMAWRLWTEMASNPKASSPRQ